MKLRIKGNTVRLRLSKPEVELLSAQGMIKEQTNFGNTSFMYSIQKEVNGNQLRADFKNDALTVYMPESLLTGWSTNNTIGFDNKQPGDPIPGLYILVEKDFKCIDNSTEDQRDNYENPKAC